MVSFDLNWLAVIVSTIVNMFIGAMWYSPLFGKPWMKELNLSMEDLKKGQ